MALCKIEGVWREGAPITKAVFDAGFGESAALDLTSCLKPGIAGAVTFASRLSAAVVDKALADDVLVLRLDVASVDLRLFSLQNFAELVEIFRPYRAVIVTDVDLDLDDFEHISQEAQRTAKDIDGRDTVYRFHAVNYFDETLCRRAFGMSASTVVSKLENRIERAEEISVGALLVLASGLVQRDELIALDRAAKAALRD
jgi:hypothetical protein